MDEYWHCPLMEGNVDELVCIDIQLVAEEMYPPYTAPKKAVNTENFKEICLDCKYHMDD